jgi:hypothetical protein
MGKNGKFSSEILTGLTLIVIGIIWTLNNYDVIDVSIWDLKSLIILFFGIFILLKGREFNNPIALIMVFIGFSLMLFDLKIIEGWTSYDIINLWPATLIIFGVSILFKRAKKIKSNTQKTETPLNKFP